MSSTWVPDTRVVSLSIFATLKRAGKMRFTQPMRLETLPHLLSSTPTRAAASVDGHAGSERPALRDSFHSI
eukprot:1069316-Pyramimonas_sp.AAC.1